MSAGASIPDGAEPRATIYVPAWLDARARLVWIRDEEARAVLASAMDQVESGWEAIRAVQRLADQYPEPERGDDGYGTLLTFAESELREVFRSMAFNLAAWVDGWPGRALPPDNDLDARLSEFGRYASVLVLATAAALEVPQTLRAAVRQVATLRPGGEWARRLSKTFATVEDLSDVEIGADTARRAVESLMGGLPEPQQERGCGMLVAEVADLYASADQPPPPWLDVLRAYFAAPADRCGDVKTATRPDR